MSEAEPTVTEVAPAPDNATAAAAATPEPQAAPVGNIMDTGTEPAREPNATAAAENFSAFDMQKATLPQDQRTLPWLGDIDSFEALVTETASLKSAIGSDKVVLPNWDNPDSVNTYYNSLGRPESVDGYDLTSFAPPEDLNWSEDLQGRMVSHMHTLGLTQKQVEGLVPAFAQEQFADLGTAVESLQAQHDTTQAALKEEFKDSYDNMLTNGASMARTQLGDEAFETLVHTKMASGGEFGNDPNFTRLLMTLASKVAVDSPIIGTAGRSQQVANTPESAVARRHQILDNPTNNAAYFGEGPADLVERIQREVQETYDDQHGREDQLDQIG